MVFHIVTLGLTALMVYTAVPGSDLFSWHPTLMTIGFSLLMAQAIVIFSPESSLLQGSDRNSKVQLHWILNLFSIVAAVGGFGAIYLNKEHISIQKLLATTTSTIIVITTQVAGKSHFTSWHGKFGLAACLGSLAAALGGLAAKYSSSLRNYAKPINVKLYHATGALVVFGLAMVATCLGCYSNWFLKRVDGYLWRCCFWSPIILLVCVARQVTQSFLPRVARPTPPSSSALKSSSTNGTRVAKTEGKRLKAT